VQCAIRTDPSDQVHTRRVCNQGMNEDMSEGRVEQ